MANNQDDREGLSPPPRNILQDLFDEDDDDIESYHAAEEQSTDASGLLDEDSDADFTGTYTQLSAVRSH
jgi:hypothetical protein